MHIYGDDSTFTKLDTQKSFFGEIDVFKGKTKKLKNGKKITPALHVHIPKNLWSNFTGKLRGCLFWRWKSAYLVKENGKTPKKVLVCTSVQNGKLPPTLKKVLGKSWFVAHACLQNRYVTSFGREYLRLPTLTPDPKRDFLGTFVLNNQLKLTTEKSFIGKINILKVQSSKGKKKHLDLPVSPLHVHVANNLWSSFTKKLREYLLPSSWKRAELFKKDGSKYQILVSTDTGSEEMSQVLKLFSLKNNCTLKYPIYRKRGFCSTIQYTILKVLPTSWKEMSVKIGNVTEKFLVKRKHENEISRSIAAFDPLNQSSKNDEENHKALKEVSDRFNFKTS